MPESGSQAQFARKYGYSRAAITQFKNQEKLVFLSPGILDFAATRQRIFDTSDPSRKDVADRHSKGRINSMNDNEQKQEQDGNQFHKAKTVREKYLALQVKLDYEQNLGLVVEKSVVEKIIYERGRQFRDGLSSLSRRLAPELIGKSDIAEVEAILTKEIRETLVGFAKLPIIEN